MALILTYTERKWDDLITDIKSERIVPIIGTEAIALYFDSRNFDLQDALKFNPMDNNSELSLLKSKLLDKITTDYLEGTGDSKNGFLLYDYLTYKLLSYCLQSDIKTNILIDNIDNINLHKAAFFFIISTKDNLMKKSELRKFLNSEINYLHKKVSSTSLDKLAKIPFFSLYITLTIDNFLAESLSKHMLRDNFFRTNAIYAGNEDFADNKFEASKPRLFSLYGSFDEKLSSDFSILEEEIIESISKLGLSELKPVKIINFVRNKNILLIGCKYSDWLLGFLLRLITENRLYTSGSTKKIFADKSFELCQTYLTQDYDVFIDKSEAIKFIDKINADCTSTDGKRIEEGGVFISFHSDDRKCVIDLKNILVAEGIPVWFDEDGLNTGNEIDRKIKDNINLSSVFIAIVSQSNISQTERYFIKEWEHAKLVKKEFRNDLVIFPLIIDEKILFNNQFITENFPNIKNETITPDKDFNKCQFDKYTNKIKNLVDQLRECVRDYRSKYNFR